MTSGKDKKKEEIVNRMKAELSDKIAVSNGEMWGFVNQSGELVIDYQFLFADYFTDKGLCAVSATGHDYIFIKLKYING